MNLRLRWVVGLVLFGLVSGLVQWTTLGDVEMQLKAGDQKESQPADLESQFEAKVFTDAHDNKLLYRILSPQNVEPGVKYPVVLFLHGAGERGDDNTAQLLHVVKELAKPEMRSRYPAFVVAPQCPKEEKWVDISWELESHTMPEKPSDSMQLTIDLLDSLPATLPIDENRVYLCGLSMGGYGVWDLMQRQPERSAGTIAICGGGDPAFAAEMTNIPIWAFHGDQDKAVKPRRSREMIHAIRQAGGRPIYTEYPGVGHNSWKVTAENRLVWDWLFAQSKSAK